MHDRCADLHRGPFAPHRCPGQKTEQRKQHLAYGDAQREHRVARGRLLHVECRDRLWNAAALRSEEHTSELQSLMRISSAVFCLKKNKTPTNHSTPHNAI